MSALVTFIMRDDAASLPVTLLIALNFNQNEVMLEDEDDEVIRVEDGGQEEDDRDLPLSSSSKLTIDGDEEYNEFSFIHNGKL